jgi:hypothetical protein
MCFVHALYREALYFGMPPSRRQELHAAAAQAFADLGAPLGLRAHHLLEAGSGHAAEAVDCAVEAAALAVDTFAFEDGMALLERARAAIPVGPLEASLRCRVMTALGEARIRAGDAEGRDVCLEAAELARSLGNAALLAQAGLAYGSVFLMGGVDPVLVSMLSDALDAASRDDAGLRAKLMARLAAARQPSPPAERERDITLALEAVELWRAASCWACSIRHRASSTVPSRPRSG